MVEAEDATSDEAKKEKTALAKIEPSKIDTSSQEAEVSDVENLSVDGRIELERSLILSIILLLREYGIRKSGAAGCICSANEALIIRKKYKNLFIVTPGIRLPGDKKNDQKRVMTPKDAFKNKASAIVLGRSLTKGNIKNNIKKLTDHLNK